MQVKCIGYPTYKSLMHKYKGSAVCTNAIKIDVPIAQNGWPDASKKKA